MSFRENILLLYPMKDGNRHLALFDFDGTLIPCDSQILFFQYVVKKEPWRRCLLVFYFLALPLALFGDSGERVLKRLFLAYLWRKDRGELRREAESFVLDVIKPLLYQDILDEMEEHKKTDSYCVLITASPSVYAEEIGKYLGVDETISTQVAIEGSMPLFPILNPPNNKGKAKVAELRKRSILPGKGIVENATSYSDSLADLPMLVLTGNNVLVNPSKKLLTELGGEGRCRVYRLPKKWKGNGSKLWFYFKNIFF